LGLEKGDLAHSDLGWVASLERKLEGNLNVALPELSGNSDLNLSEQCVIAETFDREVQLSTPSVKAGAQLVSHPTAPDEQTGGVLHMGTRLAIYNGKTALYREA
jgi:hypothetical protein